MAKKKGSSKKRRSAPPGVDPNERRRERLEARRRAKAEAIAAQQRAERRARMIRLAFYGAIFALAIWFFFLRESGRPDEIAGHPVESFSTAGQNDHAAEGETVTYETSPPVAGRHAPSPFPCGTYAEPVPNENLVHSLEHGAVYALYPPSLPVEQVSTLEGLAAEQGWEENFLVAPYDGEMPEDTLVSVGGWGHRMDLPEIEVSAIVEFYDEFEGTGTSEAGLGCPNDSDQEFEPEDDAAPAGGAEATPDPTPTPKATKKS